MNGTNFLLLFILGFALAYEKENADVLHERCSKNYPKMWPEDVKKSDLTLLSNENADFTGPIYRLESRSELRTRFVEPKTRYKFALTSSEELFQIHRFLITLNRKDDKCLPGRLESLSDESQHLSYGCPIYLIKRPVDPKDQNGSDNFSSVPFEWISPKCGCVTITARVLDTANTMFSENNDPYKSLTLNFCVKDTEKKKVDAIDELTEAEEIKENLVEEDDDDKDEADDKEEEEEVGVVVVPEKKWQRRKMWGRRRKLRKGRKFCCRKGKRSRIGQTEQPKCDPTLYRNVLRKAINKFGLKNDECKKLFVGCCQNDENFKQHKRSKRIMKKQARKMRRFDQN